VRLRGREDLDADLARARHLEERGRLVAIEGEVGVGEVVHDHQAMLAREVDDFHEEVRSTHIVVGLCGKERISSLAFGHASRAVSWSRAKKSPSGVSGTDRRSPSAMTTEYEWIG